jgi:hypothetical protein
LMTLFHSTPRTYFYESAMANSELTQPPNTNEPWPPRHVRYALFDAIVTREPLSVIRYIIEALPHSIQERPPVRPGGMSHYWPAGSTALHLAVWYGLPDDAVRFICRCHPPNLRVQDAAECLPLHYIDSHYNRVTHFGVAQALPLETIRFLVDEWQGALRHRNRKHVLVLHGAAANHLLPLETIQFLVETYPGAVRERDARGRTPLFAALELGQPGLDKVRYLIERFPPALRERSGGGDLPIHAAARNGELFGGHIRCLVEGWPESVRERDGEGLLPLHLAAGRRMHSYTLGAVRCLVAAHPPSVREAGGEEAILPVHAAIRRAAPHDVIRHLVLQDPECLAVWSGSGCLALHMAVSSAVSLETLSFVVEQHPPAVREVLRDGSGSLPLHLAARRQPGALRVLLAAWPGSALVRDRSGRTALHECARGGNAIREGSRELEAMRLLVEAGPAALRLRDSAGRIPLHVLLSGRSPNLGAVQCLVDACPESLLVPAADGSYALFVAAANPDIEWDVLYYLVKRWPSHYFVRQR